VRALLIGRRALVLLGMPLLTADYDFWIAIDQIEAFNAAVATCDLRPTVSPDVARQRGRYVIENHEHVDVLIARTVPTVDGTVVEFDALWSRRQSMTLAPGIAVQRPAIDDLILTKQSANRPKDAEDIRLLTALKAEGRS
jgi:hypothetical protein